MRAIGPRRLSICLCLSLVACQGAGEVGSRSEAILGGSAPEAGQFPTVVAILISGGQRGLCTGTLIGEDLVLTAAHCVQASGLGFADQSQVTAETAVYIDSIVVGNGSATAAADTIPHPAFRQPGDPDIGLIRLAQPRTDREPSPVNLNSSSAPVGTNVDMVGYGEDAGGSAGRIQYLESKTSTSCASSGFSDSTFMCFNQQDGTGKCSGDSGGPSFLVGTSTVVGITSFGDRDCQFFGVDMRTDSPEARAFLAENAPELSCGLDGTCDEDCDADPDCGGGPGGLGATCDDDESCQVGFCASGPGGMRCTVECTPDSSECPDGFECLDANNDTGACWPIDDGGCNSSGGGAGAGALLLIGMLLGFARRRRA
jgi:MYXO-CTERM domain-containing protein